MQHSVEARLTDAERLGNGYGTGALRLHSITQLRVRPSYSIHHLDDAQLAPEPDKEHWQQLRADLCGAEAPFAPEGDRVGKEIASFKTDIERVCLPVVKHRAGKSARRLD